MTDGAGPLAGYRVLEVGHMLAGPFCGLLLADLGAEVVKIEGPKGDIARTVSPHSVGPHNSYFASLNRNKASVVLDLSDGADRARFHELARGAHALVTNLRPSAIKKLGLTYEALAAVNPSLVCVALTGYGLEGPHAERPAYDYVIQALTGVMTLTGEPGGPPCKAGYSAVDNSAGIMAALGLVAKLVEGRGGQVDVSLHDTMLSQLNYLASGWLNGNDLPERREGGGHPYIVPAQVFPTADGHLALFITHDDFWRRFAEVAGRTDWLEDPAFATMAGRSASRDRVVAEIGAVLSTRTTAEWVEALEPRGVVVAGVQDLAASLASDLVASRAMVAEIETEAGPLRLLGNPFKIAGVTPVYTAPPLLGEGLPEDGPSPALSTAGLS